MYKLYWVLIVVILIVACKNEQLDEVNTVNSTIELKIESNQGENIIHFYKDTIHSIGLPGSIATYTSKQDLPFIVLGKGLQLGEKYLCQYIGSIDISTNKKDRMFGIAIPLNKENMTINVKSYADLTQSQSMLKVWLKDYFTFAYSKEVIKEIKWQNEIGILRALNR